MEGELAAFSTDDGEVMLVWPDDGELKAFQGTCPHQDVPLWSTFNGRIVTCQFHNWVFDGRTGKGLSPAGLFDPVNNPGQHLFTAVADPKTNAGVIAGLARIESASPVVHTRREDGHMVMTLVAEYGAAVPPGLEPFGGDWWVVGFAGDVRDGLEGYAGELARLQEVRLKPCPTGYMSWYAEKFGGALNEKAVIELAMYNKEKFGNYGYDFIQIDDLWQNGSKSNGPAKDFTKVNPTGPYPGGMKPVAGRISEIGLTPGLWILPFAINHNDEILSDRKHLVALKPDGSPYEVHWSGTALDLTRPEALAYVRKIIGLAVNEWGYSYLKLDGLHIGMASDQTYTHHEYVEDNYGDVVFEDKNQTNIKNGLFPHSVMKENVKIICHQLSIIWEFQTN